MREIKFRGKRLDYNEWRYGSLFVNNNNQCYIKEPDGKLYFIEDKDTIGQFTGMYDDSGTEIWEGDIVRMTEMPYNLEYIGKVRYNVKIGCFELEVVRRDATIRCHFIKSEIVNDGNARVPVTYLYEVMGNKWDNPSE